MLVPVLLALQSLAVSGGTCPAPADVEARVLAILQLPPKQLLTEGFSAERVQGGLRVILRSSEGALIGERLLPADGTCDELAQASAVVLSAWLSDVHPDFAAELPPAVAEPAPEPEPPPPAPLPKPQSEVPRKTSGPPARRPAASTHRWEAALGVGIDLVPGSVVPAALLTLGLEPSVQGLGLRVSALTAWTREAALDPGQVEWRRWPVAVGPSMRFAAKPLVWDFSTGIAAGWLHLQGRSFDQSKSVDDLLLGGLLGARLAGTGRTFTPFATAVLFVWPTEAVAFVRGSGAELRLPTVDVLLAAGLSWAP